MKTTRIEIFSSTYEEVSAMGIALMVTTGKPFKYVKQMFSDIGYQEAQNCEFPRQGKQISRGECPHLMEGVPSLLGARGPLYH